MDPSMLSAFRDVANLIKSPTRAPGTHDDVNLQLRQGVVSSISGSTINVLIGGSTKTTPVTNVLNKQVAAGNTVWLIQNGTDYLLIEVQATYTKDMWIPGGIGFVGIGSPTYGSTGSWATIVGGWNLPHGSLNGIELGAILPSDATGGGATADAYFTTVGTPLGNVKVDGQGQANALGSNSTGTGAIPPGASTVMAATGLLQKASIGTINGTPSAGTYINCVFDRDGGNASDTCAQMMIFLGIMVHYQAYRS